MAKNLVIVESPSKTKTIQGILGRDYKVVASKGHIRQLAKSRTKNDINLPISRNDKNAHISIPGVQKKGKKFIPRWAAIDDVQKKTISTLKKEVQRSDNVFLATDPDREGEAIAWHIVDALNLDVSSTKRVVFNQITKNAVETAFENSKQIDDYLVEAYKARAIQDKVWGFMMSQTLWPTIKRNLSAGRVQSPTLGEIDKKEKEIKSFVPEEYWSIDSKFQIGQKSEPLQIPLKKIINADQTINVESRELKTEQESIIHTEALNNAKFSVSDINTKERRSNPPQPLRTSTLQQQAFRRFRFNSSRTMSLAQQLYQGIDLGAGEGQVGLITYMRTDSNNLSNEVISDISDFVTQKFSKSYLQVKKNSKSVQGAQEAHEAIRPTYISRTPESLRNHLDQDQFKLYQLIWNNTVASQMAAAIYDRTTFEITANTQDSDTQYVFNFSGDVLKFDGYKKIITDKKNTYKRDVLNKLPIELTAKIMMKIWATNYSHKGSLDKKHILKISNLIYKNSGKKVYLPGKIILYFDKKTFTFLENGNNSKIKKIITKKYTKLNYLKSEETITTSLPNTKYSISAKLDKCPSNFPPSNKLVIYISTNVSLDSIKLRTITRKDVFRPLGMKEEINAYNFLKKQNIPDRHREEILVLENEKGIIWIVGLRVAEWAKVKKFDSNATKLSLNYLK